VITERKRKRKRKRKRERENAREESPWLCFVERRQRRSSFR